MIKKRVILVGLITLLLVAIIVGGILAKRKASNFDSYCEDVAVTLVNSLHNTEEDFSKYEGKPEYDMCVKILDNLQSRGDVEINLTEKFNLNVSPVDDLSMYQSEIPGIDVPTPSEIVEEEDEVWYFTPEEVEQIKKRHDSIENGGSAEGYFFTEEEYNTIITTGKLSKDNKTTSPEVYTKDDGDKYIKVSSLYPAILTADFPIYIDGVVRYMPKTNLKEPLSSICTNPDYNMYLDSVLFDKNNRVKKYTFKSRTTSKKVLVTISYDKYTITNITLGGV